MKIYLDDNNYINVPVSDDSYRYRSIMGENALTVKITTPVYKDINVGARVKHQGEWYEIMRPQSIIKNNSRDFELTLIFESAGGTLSKYKFKDPQTNRLSFSLTATAREHLQYVIDNLNMREKGNNSSEVWEIGRCLADTDEKVINYSYDYCIDALKKIADEFGTEYEIKQKVIHLGKVEYNKETPLPLSYGYGNGFKSGVKRDNYDQSCALDVLYVQGGEQNINASDYGSQVLLLPKNETCIYEGREYISDSDGFSIRRKELRTGYEGSLDCTHIYPKRVGHVTTVNIDPEKGIYEFTDEEIPEGLNYADYRMNGEKMTVIFQSGQLAGKEFDIVQTEYQVTGYVHSERKFRLVSQNIDGVTMPGEQFKPAPGNKYAVFHMKMPDAYISDRKEGAEWRMFEEAAKYLYENEDPRFSFTGELDGIWARKNWKDIGKRIMPGAYVSFTDEQFQSEPVSIRVTGIKDFIHNPYSPQIELSNVTAGAGFSNKLNKLEAQEVSIEEHYKSSMQYTKRGFHDVKETTEALEASLLNFDKSISPVSVQTMQLIAGDDTLQFVFVDGKNSSTEVEHKVEFSKKDKELRCEKGWIQHKTIGINMVSPTHDPSDYRYWNLPELKEDLTAYADKYFYLYAVCSKSNETGWFDLLEDAKAMEPEDEKDNYYFLVGIVNSEVDGPRSFSPMYGFTEVLPGQITTKMIADKNRNLIIDLEKGEIIAENGAKIKGDIEFLSNDGYVDVQQGINNAIGDIEIGGENIVLDSAQDITNTYIYQLSQSISSNNAGQSIVLSFDYEYKNVNTDKYTSRFGFSLPVRVGQQDNYDIQAFVGLSTNSSGLSGKGRCTKKIVIPNINSGSNYIYTTLPYYKQVVSGDVTIRNVQLSFGNKETSWKPSTADFSYLTDAIKGSTEVNGGLIATNLLQLKGIKSDLPNLANKNHITLVPKDSNFNYEAIKGSNMADSTNFLLNDINYTIEIGSSHCTSGNAIRYEILLIDLITSTRNWYVQPSFSNSPVSYDFKTPQEGQWSLIIYAGVPGATKNVGTEYINVYLHYKQDKDKLVNTGISGMDDNIALWTGGTYEMAQKELASTLLRKDGSGFFSKGMFTWDTIGDYMRFGIFSVLPDRIIVSGNEGNIIITSLPMGEVMSESKEINGSGRDSFSIYNSSTRPVEQLPNPYTSITYNEAGVTGSNYKVTLNVDLNCRVFANAYEYLEKPVEAVFRGSFYFQIVCDGKIILDQLLASTSIWAESMFESTPMDNFFSFKKTLTYDVRISGNTSFRIVIKDSQIIADYPHELGYANINYGGNFSVKAVSTAKETILASDGILVRQDSNSNSEFRVMRKSNELVVSMKGLRDTEPTYKGEIWNDNGTIKIKTEE